MKVEKEGRKGDGGGTKHMAEIDEDVSCVHQ